MYRLMAWTCASGSGSAWDSACNHILGHQLRRLREVARDRKLLRQLTRKRFGPPQAVSRPDGIISDANQHTLIAAMAGPRPPSPRYCLSPSASGLVVTKPSPMRAATSIAFGPKAETSTGGATSGNV